MLIAALPATGKGSATEGMMKELTYSFAQLLAIVMMMITLAISTAAVAQWAG